MKIGDEVVYKKKVIEKLARNSNNTQADVKMEIYEIHKSVIIVESGGCLIKVNPNAIELA